MRGGTPLVFLWYFCFVLSHLWLAFCFALLPLRLFLLLLLLFLLVWTGNIAQLTTELLATTLGAVHTGSLYHAGIPPVAAYDEQGRLLSNLDGTCPP